MNINGSHRYNSGLKAEIKQILHGCLCWSTIERHFDFRIVFMFFAICLLAFTGCSSVESRVGQGSHAALIGKMDTDPSEAEDAVAAKRTWYQMIE
jgi:hypothetical protein